MRFFFRPRINLFDMMINGGCLGAAFSGTSWWIVGGIMLISVVFSVWMEEILEVSPAHTAGFPGDAG